MGGVPGDTHPLYSGEKEGGRGEDGEERGERGEGREGGREKRVRERGGGGGKRWGEGGEVSMFTYWLLEGCH